MCLALLFLGNVYIPDTLLSPQGFSRLCIFCIAEQGPGRAGGLLLGHFRPSGCPLQVQPFSGRTVFLAKSHARGGLPHPGVPRRPQSRCLGALLSVLTPAWGLRPRPTRLDRTSGRAAVGFAALPWQLSRDSPLSAPLRPDGAARGSPFLQGGLRSPGKKRS